MMERLHCSWQELQDLPGGLRQIFAAFMRGETKARDRQTQQN
jgi:hypothetical protein